MAGRQESTRPKLRPDDGATGTEHNKRGLVLIFTTQPIRCPRAERWPNRLLVSRIHQQQSGFVIGLVGVHGSNDAQVVSAFCNIWKKFADDDAAFAMRSKLEGRRHQSALLATRFLGNNFAFVLLKIGFGVKRVDMRRPAVHEKKDDPFGFRGEMSLRNRGK